MRIHPISLALRFLKGRKRTYAGPYGRQVFRDDEHAVSILRKFTGQDFGRDAKKWGEWLRKNRWVYYTDPGQLAQRLSELQEKRE